MNLRQRHDEWMDRKGKLSKRDVRDSRRLLRDVAETIRYAEAADFKEAVAAEYQQLVYRSTEEARWFPGKSRAYLAQAIGRYRATGKMPSDK